MGASSHLAPGLRAEREVGDGNASHDRDDFGQQRFRLLRRFHRACAAACMRACDPKSMLLTQRSDFVVHGLDAGTFDRFVPAVDAVTTAAISDAGERFVHPSEATIVVVGDEGSCRGPLEALGREVVAVTPEF